MSYIKKYQNPAGPLTEPKDNTNVVVWLPPEGETLQETFPNSRKVTDFDNHPVITQGYRVVGSKGNDHRVGQSSVFGERKYVAPWNQSIAQRLWNSFTDATHLTSPPTYQDGDGRALNAENPFWDGAKGKELKRMGKTALGTGTIIGLGFLPQSFASAPAATAGAFGLGLGADFLAGKAMDGIEKNVLNRSGLQFSDNQKLAVRLAAGLYGGSKGYKLGKWLSTPDTPIVYEPRVHQNDYINAPGNAEGILLDKNTAIINKQTLGQLSSKNPSKLTKAELEGWSKHERTNTVNVRKPIKVNSSLPHHDKVLKALDRDVPLLDDSYFSALGIDFDLIRNNLIKNGYKEATALTNEQIHKLISVRQYDIINGSNNPGVYAIRTPYITENSLKVQVPEYRSYTGNRNTGFIGIIPNDPVGYNKVGMIQNLTKGTEEPIKGVGEVLYNVALKDMPIRTGDYVLDGKAIPAITSKFKRELIENTGKYIIDGESFYNQPVYNLLEPTFDVPYKYLDDFTLDNLDDNGIFIVDFPKGPTYKSGGRLNVFNNGGPKQIEAIKKALIEVRKFGGKIK